MFGVKKRGAEETNALIWVVLALLVVGVFALFYFKVYSQANSALNLSPSDRTLAIQVCKASSSLDNTVYCGDFKKLDSGYYSCYALAEMLPAEDVSEWKKAGAACSDDYPRNKCKELNQTQGFKKAVVNGKDCEVTPAGKLLWNSNEA